MHRNFFVEVLESVSTSTYQVSSAYVLSKVESSSESMAIPSPSVSSSPVADTRVSVEAILVRRNPPRTRNPPKKLDW